MTTTPSVTDIYEGYCIPKSKIKFKSSESSEEIMFECDKNDQIGNIPCIYKEKSSNVEINKEYTFSELKLNKSINYLNLINPDNFPKFCYSDFNVYYLQ